MICSDNIKQGIISKVLQDGIKVKDIVTTYNVSKSCIYKWLRKYKVGSKTNEFVDLSDDFNSYLNSSSNDILKLVINDVYTIEFDINKLSNVLEAINNASSK